METTALVIVFIGTAGGELLLALLLLKALQLEQLRGQVITESLSGSDHNVDLKRKENLYLTDDFQYRY